MTADLSLAGPCCRKIDEQISQGADPYELKVEQKQRQQPAGKKQGKKKKQRKARKQS